MSYWVSSCALSVQMTLVSVIQHDPEVRPLTSPTMASGFQGSTHGSTTAPGGANANGGGGGGGGPGEADSRSSSARSSMDEVPQALPRNREPSWGSGLAAGGARPRSLLDYNVYMAKYINPQDETESSAAAARHSPESSPLAAKRVREGGREGGREGWMG